MQFQRVPDFRLAVSVELLLKRLQRIVDQREIEAHHDVAMPILGRVPPDVGAAEYSLELGCPTAVVIVLQQRYPQ